MHHAKMFGKIDVQSVKILFDPLHHFIIRSALQSAIVICLKVKQFGDPQLQHYTIQYCFKLTQLQHYSNIEVKKSSPYWNTHFIDMA